VLWFQLRDHRLAGWKLKRQVPIDRFVVDFLCTDAKLIVEIDGRQHDHSGELEFGRGEGAHRARGIERLALAYDPHRRRQRRRHGGGGARIGELQRLERVDQPGGNCRRARRASAGDPTKPG
jgi:hypothetical protein